MPDSSSASTSLRRDPTPHQADPPPSELESDDFQLNAAELIHDLLAPDLLSLAWTSRLIDTFLLCLEQFRALLFGYGAAAALARPPLHRFVADFLDRAIKALDLCNALRDGLQLLRHCRTHLAVAAGVLASSDAALGEAQLRRARKALTDLTILMLNDRDAALFLDATPHRNRSFGRALPLPLPGQGHHRRTSSGSASASANLLRSLSWSVSRAWSAARQLQALGTGIPVPRTNDIIATENLSPAVYTMSAVLFVVVWALVAAIPCQDRGLHAHFSVSKIFAWSDPVTALYERILDESKRKDRRNSCGLLKEIHQMELCSRRLMEITDAAEFPLPEDKDAEVREAAQGLVQLCGSLKGLDPLERKVREMFHRLVRTRTEILDCLGRPNNTD